MTAAAQSDGTARRRFVLCALAVLVPAMLFWWLLGAEAVAAALRPLVAALCGLLMPITAIRPTAAHGWLVETGIQVVAGKAAARMEVATFEFTPIALHGMTLCWPLLLALMLAPPRPPVLARRLCLGLAALVVLFAVSCCVEVFVALVLIVNHEPSRLGQALPAMSVAWPPYGATTVFLARVGETAFVPVNVLAAPVLWLWLNPTARHRFLAGMFVHDGAEPREPAAGR